MHVIRLAAFLLTALAPVLLGNAATPVRDIPKAAWEPIYFRSIDQFSHMVNWRPLRDLALGADTFEVRVWIGFGVGPLEALSIRREGSTWSGRYAIHRLWLAGPVAVQSVTPKSAWDQLWARLVQLDLLKLPDSSTLPRSESMVADGVSYVVEINKDGRYRTYMYANPVHKKWPEAKRMIEIVETLRNEIIPKF
jgi:hypothetical protein